jgi:phosphate transport system permease protein
MSTKAVGRELLTSIPAQRRLANTAFGFVCLFATVIGIILLFVLLYQVFRQGAAYVTPTFFQKFASVRPENSGIKAALIGSLWVMFLTAIVTIPIGVAAAVYLEEFTKKKSRFTSMIEIAIANLAGVPSIVYGLLGLTLFVRWMMLDRSIISGALTMSLLVLPMLITVTQEALKAVPNSYREASYGLGASDWQTIWRQVLPNASGGIFTGIILSMSRAIGETAPLIMIGAVSFVAFTPEKLSDSFTVLPIQIYNWVSLPNPKFQDLAAAGILVLLVVLLSMNAFAIFLRIRSRK